MTDAPGPVPPPPQPRWTSQPPMPPPPPPRPPRKWLGPWGGLWIALASVAIIGLEFLEGFLLRGIQAPSPREYNILDPVLLVIGSGCVAAGFLYTMAYRLEPRWHLSPARLIGGGLIAGFFAAVAAGMVNGAINAVAGGNAASPATVTLITVGLVEEAAKLGAVLVLARGLPVKNGRVGLFVGGAVGFGFAAFENTGYLETAWSLGLHSGSPIGSTLVAAISRQLLGPFLHPVLTGLASAAVFAASREGRFRITFGVVGAYLVAAAAHSLYDLGASAGAQISNIYLAAAVALVTIVCYLAASFTAWLLISRAMKRRDAPSTAPPPLLPPGA